MNITSSLDLTHQGREYLVKFTVFLESNYGADRDGNRGHAELWFEKLQVKAYDGSEVDSDTMEEAQYRVRNHVLFER